MGCMHGTPRSVLPRDVGPVKSPALSGARTAMLWKHVAFLGSLALRPRCMGYSWRRRKGGAAQGVARQRSPPADARGTCHVAPFHTDTPRPTEAGTRVMIRLVQSACRQG